MQHPYFIRYEARHADNRTSSHTRIVELSHPIAYVSDIVELQTWAVHDHQAQGLDVQAVALVDWRPLLGAQRPAAQPVTEAIDAQLEQPVVIPPAVLPPDTTQGAA